MRLSAMPGRGQSRGGGEACAGKPEAFPLCDLRNGESATITRIAGDYPHPELLEGYGFASGVRVVRERTAPQGDPIIFRVEGRLIALRREDAVRISVKREIQE